MYESDYWISADKQTDDFGSYYITIKEVYPLEYKISDDIHNFGVLSTLHRDGVLVTFNGMRNVYRFHMSECWSVLCRLGSLGAK